MENLKNMLIIRAAAMAARPALMGFLRDNDLFYLRIMRI